MLHKIKNVLKKCSCIVALYEGSIKGYYALLTKMREKRAEKEKFKPVQYGNKNRRKKFFLIAFEFDPAMGLYSMILVVMIPFIDYAVKRRWIPVIDLRPTHMSLIQDEDKMGIENAWEYYYEQPNKQYNVEEVYQSKNVLNAEAWFGKIKAPQWRTMCPASKKDMKYWHKLIKSYIRLTSDMENRLAFEREKIFKPGQRVLGVGIRAGLRHGAMRNMKIFNDHPKQPTCEEMMEIVEDKMKEWNCSHLFLSCDDREYSNKFISKWGDKCCHLDRKLTHYFENDEPVSIYKVNVEFEGCSAREKTEDYLIETYLLAECDCFYSCHGGGATFAYFLNGGKYEHIEVYDKGVYSGLTKLIDERKE